MAIANKNDLSHIVRTTQQWTASYDSYECIPEGVLCVEFTPDGHVKAKIGNGHDIFSKLPYIGGADLTNYYTKSETAKCVEEIIKANRFIRIKGILQNKDQLPSNADCGDLYFVISQNQSSSNKYDEYVYSPSNTWENLGSIPIDIDLSEYAKIVYVDEKIDEVNERIDDIEQHGTHTHANKDILDLITAAFTAEEKDKLSTLYNYDDTELRELITQASHTHSNKDILDAISAPFTKEDKSKLDKLNPYDDSILKEKITALERLAHEHSNKRILDRTTASFTTEYERKMRWIRIYTGCTGMEEGIAGLVPAAQAGEEDYVLSGSGEWVPQTGGGGTYELPIATASTLGGIKVGDGLEIDANGKLSVVGGGGGGDSITEGDGITITTDPQTGVKTISVNTGDHLSVDSQTGELNVTGVDYTAGHGIHIGADYTLIEYIKNSGNYDQIILTDIIPSSTDRFEMDVKFGAATGLENNKPIYGAVGTNQGYYNAIWVDNTNSFNNLAAYNHFAWQSGRDSNRINANDTIKYEGNNPRQLLTVTRNTMTWGNVTTDFSDQIDPSFSELTIPIAIFGRNIHNTGFAAFTMMELFVYGVKLYDSNNTLLHDLRPAERGTDGEAGLYDLVTHKFYGNAGNGSFVKGLPISSVDDRLISAKIGNGLQFDSNDAIEVNTGDGLQINQDGEVEIDPSIIPEVTEYEAGEAIEITEVTHGDEFRVQNQEYFFDTRGLTCGLNARIWTTVNDGDILAAMCIHNSGGNQVPLFVGLTEDSVKVSQNYDSTILGPNGSFDYRGKTWYFTADYALSGTDGQDTQGHIQTLPTTYSFNSTPSNFVPAAKDLIDLAVLLSDLEYPVISVKYNKGLTVNQDNELEVNLGSGLQFDSNGAIEVTESGGIDFEPGDGLEMVQEGYYDQLPLATYSHCDYVENTNDARCQIDYLPPQNVRVTGKFSPVQALTDGPVFGSRTNSNTGGHQFVLWCSAQSTNVTPYKIGFVSPGNQWGTASEANGGTLTTFVPNDIINFDIDFPNAHVLINDENFQPINVSSSQSATVKLGIFSCAKSDTPTWEYKFCGKIYGMKFYVGNAMVINLVPAVRDSDNVVGFYDNVNDVFYTSLTSTAFSTDTSTITKDEPSTQTVNVLNVTPATSGNIGGVIPRRALTVDHKGRLDVDLATSTTPGIITPKEGLNVDANGELTVAKATSSTMGGLKIGSGIIQAPDGTVNVSAMEPFDIGDGLELEYDSEDALPTGYAYVDYISSNPTSATASSAQACTVIDYIPNANTRYKVRGSRNNNNTATSRNCFCGAKQSSNDYQSALVFANSGTNKSDVGLLYGSAQWADIKYNFDYVPGDIVVIEADANSLKVDGTTVATYTPAGNLPAFKIGVFGATANGNATPGWTDSYPMNGRIYYLKIYEGNTLVVNLIPAYRYADDAVGFYDNINDKFYTSITNYPFTTDISTLNPDPANRKLNVVPATANTIGGIKVGSGLSITADGTLSATGGGGSGGGPEYVEGDAIEIDTHALSFNVDAIRWDISDIKSIYQQAGPYTQMRSVEFCDSSNAAHALDSGSAIWDDGDTVSYAAVSETIDELVANTGKMCAVWRYPNHVLKLTFNLDTATPLSDIVKFRMKTANDTPERDPKAWKIYVRNATTQQWYLVHETLNAEITGTRDTWSDYYTFTSATETSINVKYGNGLTLNQNNELEVNIGDRLHFDSNNALAVNPYYEGEGISIHTMGVPIGYTRVKALSSTDGGNQYIDTGYKINPNTVIELTAVFYKYGSNQWKIPLGTRNASNYADNGILFLVTWATDQPGNNPSLWIERIQSVAPSDKKDEFYNDIVNIRIAGTSLTCTNTRTGVTTVLDTATAMPISQYNLFVFATNDHGNMSFHTQMDLYSLTISEADTVIHQYIPCKRDSDNKYGLYDTIDQEFKLSPNNALFTYVAGAPSGDDPLIEEISLLPATEDTLGGIKIGEGLSIDQDGYVSSKLYEAGHGIVFDEATPEGQFKVRNLEYYFDNQVSCQIDGNYGPRTFTRVSQYEQCLAVIWPRTLSGQGWANPLFVGLTENSVKLTSSADSNILGPSGSFEYRGYTWYYTCTYGLMNSSGVDLLGNLPTMSYTDSTDEVDGSKHLIDLAGLVLYEESIDVWNSGTGWLNGAYNDSQSDQFWTNWYYTYHSKPDEYLEVPAGAIKMRQIGISNENDSRFEGGGVDCFNSSHHHFATVGCVTDEWFDIPEGTVYLQFGVKWNELNNRTISSSDIKSVTIEFYYDTPRNDTINAKLGNGLEFDSNDAIQVKLGDGLGFDANGALEVTGGGSGGDSIAEGEGITITTDSQTGVKTIGINVGDGLTIDPITNALMTDGQLPEGTIIKKLTYVGDGSTSSKTIQFDKKPLVILNIYGCSGTNYIASIGAPIDAPYLQGNYGGVSTNGNSCSCAMSYNDSTNELTFTPSSGGGGDSGLLYNANGITYTMYYLTKGHTGSGTSVNNEVSVVKTFSYVGTGTSTNNIQFPETPDYVLSISGPLGSVGDILAHPIDIKHPTSTSQYMFQWTQSNTSYVGRGTYTFSDSTNVLSLIGADYGGALNYTDNVYYVRYVVNEVISTAMPYDAGEAISIETIGGLQPTNYSNDDFVDSIVSMNAGSIVKAADKSSFTLTASMNDCYTRGSSGQANGSYPYNVKASTKYRLAWDSADPTVHGKVYTYENGLYDAMMHEIDQYDSSYLEFTTSPNTTFIQARFGVMYAGDSITYSNVRLYEVIEDEDQYNEISVKHGDGLIVNERNELEVCYGNGLEIVSDFQYRPEYYFNTQVQCQVHTDSYYSTSASFDRTYQKTTIEPALCCIWEVGDSGALWTGPLLVGTTATSVQYTTQDTQQTVTYQNTFQYLGQTWYTSGYPDFLNAADHEDKLGYLQYLGSYPTVSDQIQAAKDLIDLAVINAGSLQAKLGNGLSFDANGAIQVTGGGGGSGDTVAQGAGIEITTDQQTGNKVIAVNAGTGLQVDQTTNELEIDDSVVTDDDELTLVFVPDDYQPS